MFSNFRIFILAITLVTFAACANKTDEPVETETEVQTTTPTTTDDNGTTIIIEGGEKGKVEVESKEGSNVEIDLDKKGGSIKVEDGDNKIDVKVKDDNKK